MKFARRDNRSALSTSRLTLALALAGLLPLLLYGSAPSWWSQRGVLVEEATADDYAPVNQGQLKNIAKAAVAEMDAQLSGGAGSELQSMIESWSSPNSTTNDFAPVNLGQLKTIAKPFYDRLIAAGLAAQYPWSGAASPPDDFAVANIGQVKNLFSFGLTSIYDSDSDGLPDAWEQEHFGTIGVEPSADADGDGFTNLEEFLSGADPKDFFNGVVPALEIISGNNQTGDLGAFLAEPLAVRVRRPSGEPLNNAPITFSAISGTFAAAADGVAPESPSLTVRTGPDGQALAYFRSPSIDNVSSVINATADSPNATGVLEFVAWTNPSLPLPVSDVQAVTLPDGSTEISWVAGSTNEDYYVIKRQKVDGTWEEIGYADAGSLSFTLPPPRNAVDVPDTRNYIVEPTNGVGSAPSAETNPPRVQYAVVDLGSDLPPIRVTNSGYILLSDGAMAQRWHAGQLETLEGEWPWALDMNEEGTAVGYVESNFEAPAGYSPPWLKSSAAVAWPATVTTPTILSSPTFAYSINGRSGQVGGATAFAIDNDGHIYGGALGNYAQRDGYNDANGEFHPTAWGFYHTGWDFTSSNSLGELSLSLVNDSYEVTGHDRVVDWARNGITIGRVGANFGDPNWDYGSQFTYYGMNGAYRNTVNGQVVDFRPLRLNSSGTVLAMHMVGHPFARLLYNTADRSRKDLQITPPVTVWGPNLWAAAINHRRIPMLDPTTGKPLLDGSGQPRTKESPQVVGEDETLWDNAATIWEENPRTGRYEMEYLQRLISPDSGWELQNAYDINDNGVITCDGWHELRDAQGGRTGNREWRAALLVPLEIKILSPVTNARYPSCSDITFKTKLSGRYSDDVARIEYWVNGLKVGESTNKEGWGAVWSSPAKNQYTVTAKAFISNFGSYVSSESRNFAVLPITGKAVQLIYDFEVGGGQSYYENVIGSSPEWPGKKSGITIGIGYDLRHNSPEQVRRDWEELLPPTDVDRLVELAQRVGSDSLKDSVDDIVIPWNAAEQVFYNRTLPRYIAETLSIYPNADVKLSPNDFGVLVSLVLNRGPSLKDAGRSTQYGADPAMEMRQIADALTSGNYAAIPQYLRNMKRLWPDLATLPRRKRTEHQGLRRRRDREASFYDQYLNSYDCD